MTIVCGTDFSELSARAVTAAAHLAARMKVPLHLLHTLEVADDEESDEVRKVVWERAMARLRGEAERLRPLLGSVGVHVEVGLPDDVLLDVASRLSAKLIVLGAAGRRHGKTELGGHADRITQRAQVPVLVIRDGTAFEQWALASKPLRVVVGIDSSVSAEAAMRWVNELWAFGPCEVVAVHLYWPPEQFQRLGLGGVRSYIDADPEVTRTLERELAERFSRLPGSKPMKYRLEPNLGRIADRLAQLATEERADLVVAGSHHRNALERLWEGSVSRGIVRWGRCSVVCVPGQGHVPMQAIPVLSEVLVATDFSAVGDAAVPFAYAAVNRGGTVHLVHVVPTSFDPIAPHDIFPNGHTSDVFETVKRRLLEKVPEDAVARGLTTHVHVLESHDPAGAICQAAERLSVDLVCLGTHGRSGVAKVVLGSVAQGVLSQSRRPVLVTRAPLD